MNYSNIENIIFDLGGVIINLDMEHAFDRFSQLFGKDVRSKMMEDYQKYQFFHDFEVGKISEDTFRNELKSLTHTHPEDAMLDAAWNAMLGDIPVSRLHWLEELAAEYQIYILSNTNAIHIRHFNEIFKEATGGKLPGDVFKKTYYSHEINDRKPNRSCFEFVLADAGIAAKKTLFYDDNAANIAAAKTLGIRAIEVQPNMLTKEMLPNGRK